MRSPPTRTVELPPAAAHDPIARDCSWSSISQAGGATFPTHHLRRIDVDRLEYRPTWSARILALGPTVAAMGVAVALLANGFRGTAILLAILSVGGSVWLLRRSTASMVFDRKAGTFWPARSRSQGVRLSQIHAIQLLRQDPSAVNEDGSVYYEMNLLSQTGVRSHVLCHGKLPALQADADAIAGFLGVPVWDTADGHVRPPGAAAPTGSR